MTVALPYGEKEECDFQWRLECYVGCVEVCMFVETPLSCQLLNHSNCRLSEELGDVSRLRATFHFQALIMRGRIFLARLSHSSLSHFSITYTDIEEPRYLKVATLPILIFLECYMW